MEAKVVKFCFRGLRQQLVRSAAWSPDSAPTFFFPAGATPLSATASKNRSMTALPCRRFDSEICSFGKCAWPELWPIGRCNAGQPKAFSRNGTHGIEPPSRTRIGSEPHSSRIARSSSRNHGCVRSPNHQSAVCSTVSCLD